MLLEYLKKIFGEPAVKECNLNLRWLPLYLSNTYRFYGISIYNKSYAFALPQSTLNLKSYKVQEKKAEDILSVPVVLCADKLMFQQRENLINSGVEFVEPGKQIYMPSLGVVLNDKRNSADTKPIEKFTPQIQLCALFFLYKKEKEYTAKEISETTGLNVMAVSRGVSALTELELLLVRKAARTNYYTIKASKNKFLESIKDYLISPVLKRVYADGKTFFNVGIKINEKIVVDFFVQSRTAAKSACHVKRFGIAVVHPRLFHYGKPVCTDTCDQFVDVFFRIFNHGRVFVYISPYRSADVDRFFFIHNTPFIHDFKRRVFLRSTAKKKICRRF